MGFGQYSGSTYGRSLVKSRADFEGGAHKQKRYTFGTHANTCHVWAQQDADTYTGQSSDGRIRFDGPTIYSYGTHFPMARFAGEYDGRRVVLVNADSYSISTSQHQGHVWSALSASDIAISVPHLNDFNEQPSKAELRRVHDALLEDIAGLIQAAEQTDVEYRHDYREAFQAKSREALAAFRALYKVRLTVPDDPVAWSQARKEAAQRKALQAKLDKAKGDARRIAEALRSGVNPEFFNPPSDNADSYAIESKIRSLTFEAKRYYSTRNVLAKCKGPRKLIKACSTAIKLVQQARKPWDEALAPAKARESRENDLNTIAEITKNGSAYGTLSERARLWSVAIRENLPDAAEILRREVQVRQWEIEVPETFKRYTYGSERVTVEDWINGKGNGYQYGFNSVEVRRKGDKLETSKGAECPFSHAVAAFKAAQRCRAEGETWQSNGHKIRVGHFGVERIEADGTLTAGCHVIPFANMLRLAVKEIPQDVRPSYPLPAVI